MQKAAENFYNTLVTSAFGGSNLTVLVELTELGVGQGRNLPEQSGLPFRHFHIVGVQILSFQNRAWGNVNTLCCLGRMLVTHETNSVSFAWLPKHPCVCAGLSSVQISVGVIEERAAAKGK